MITRSSALLLLFQLAGSVAGWGQTIDPSVPSQPSEAGGFKVILDTVSFYSPEPPELLNKKVNEALQAQDLDHDGIPDNEDDCPKEYGTVRGCPDSDEDGTPDFQDKCPFQRGPMEKNGCLDTDGDGDGVPDAVDKCPTLAGKKNWQGCPDSDGDGIPDHLDKCPKEAGLAVKDGCP
jgi:hypothetical protein